MRRKQNNKRGKDMRKRKKTWTRGGLLRTANGSTGYKDHINMDNKSKIITKYVAADAAVHDSQQVKKRQNNYLR
jgi:IS5 family transposase